MSDVPIPPDDKPKKRFRVSRILLEGERFFGDYDSVDDVLKATKRLDMKFKILDRGKPVTRDQLMAMREKKS